MQAFPNAEAKVPVSTNGGSAPRWRADGRELYFVAPDGVTMAAAVDGSGSSFDAEPPTRLFPSRLAGERDHHVQSSVRRHARWPFFDQPAGAGFRCVADHADSQLEFIEALIVLPLVRHPQHAPAACDRPSRDSTPRTYLARFYPSQHCPTFGLADLCLRSAAKSTRLPG